MSCWPALAREKKTALPPDVLRAHRVLVVIRSDAKERLSDPDANIQAKEDVRKALERWHRFEITLDGSEADLIMVIRKGTGQFISPVIEDNPMDSVHVINPRVGVGSHSPESVDHPPTDDHPHPGLAVGKADDVIEVYLSNGSVENALDGAPVWRCQVKDGLKSPTLPAVEQFRKAVEAG